MKYQGSMLSLKPTSHIELSANENYLGEPQDTESKRTITNFRTEFKELKEVTKKQLSDLKENELEDNEHLGDVQENTNIRPMEMRKTVWDWKNGI